MSDSVIPWTVAYQAPLSMGFPRQEYRSGFSFPSPGDLPKPGIKPRSPALQADTLLSEPPETCVQSLEEGMAIHFSILTWGIPWTKEPGEAIVYGVAKRDATERLAL